MEIKYNDYGDLVYDKKYFEPKLVSDLCIGDMIIYKNNAYKITKISMSVGRKQYLRWIYITNVFTDEKNDSVFYETQHVLIPKIKTNTNEFINITNTKIQLFNEDANDIVEIDINLEIDKHIVEKINEKIKTNVEFKITTIEFKNLIRIVEIN
jgi:translation elongation factor P/translation initiation factor 5A